jgi:D-alanyl-D-alanine carboxypeptidase/D-alanyl-D-alanine-endopeptidase (penicillin-binding protein 4)
MMIPRQIASLCLVVIVAFSFSLAQAQKKNAPAHAAPLSANSELGEKINAIVSAPDVNHASWGISVTTLDGQPLFGLNDAKLMTPASNVKMVTTAAAYGLLPETMTWNTLVVATGPIGSDGVLKGNLVILGAGDPTLSIRHYPYRSAAESAAANSTTETTGEPAPKPKPLEPLEELAAQVEQAGIRQVTGSVIGDDSFFLYEPYATSWDWDDLVWPYGAGASALTFNENAIELTLLPNPEAPGSFEPEWNPNVQYFALDNTTKPVEKGQKPQPGVDRRPGSITVRAFGTIPAEGFHVDLAVEDPAEFTAQAFQEALVSRGVKVAGTPESAHRWPVDTAEFKDERAKPITLRRIQDEAVYASTNGNQVVAKRVSVPLGEDLKVINKVSQNLHAELILRLLGKLEGEDGSIVQGARVVRRFLLDAGIDDADFYFYDGSGMSMDDRMTPRAFTRLLSYAAKQSWGDDWRKSFPIAGVDGTLSARFKNSPLKDNMQAKTGTHSEANALSGYMKTQSGRTVAFSIMVNSHQPGGEAEVRAIDKIAEAIYAAQ